MGWTSSGVRLREPLGDVLRLHDHLAVDLPRAVLLEEGVELVLVSRAGSRTDPGRRGRSDVGRRALDFPGGHGTRRSSRPRTPYRSSAPSPRPPGPSPASSALETRSYAAVELPSWRACKYGGPASSGESGDVPRRPPHDDEERECAEPQGTSARGACRPPYHRPRPAGSRRRFCIGGHHFFAAPS